MRPIDADALVAKMNLAIAMLKRTMKNFDIEDDPECQMELKAYQDIRDGIKEEHTIEPEPKWIPCSERLPEEGQGCLVCYKGSILIDTFIGHGNPYNWKWYTRDYEAWMPLPEPWRGEGEAE